MSDFKLGSHEAQIAGLREDVAEIRGQIAAQGAQIQTIHTFVAEVRGGWKTAGGLLLGIGAAMGAVLAFIVNLVGLFGGKK